MRWTGTFWAGFDFIGFANVQPAGRTFNVEHAHAFRLAEASSPSAGPSATTSPCTTSSYAAPPHDSHHLPLDGPLIGYPLALAGHPAMRATAHTSPGSA